MKERTIVKAGKGVDGRFRNKLDKKANCVEKNEGRQVPILYNFFSRRNQKENEHFIIESETKIGTQRCSRVFLKSFWKIYKSLFTTRFLVPDSALGCARFGEFWLFFTEQAFTLPLFCYEKSNQGAQEFTHKSAKRAGVQEDHEDLKWSNAL